METKITTTFNFALKIDGLSFSFSIEAETKEKAQLKLAELLVRMAKELAPTGEQKDNG